MIKKLVSTLGIRSFAAVINLAIAVLLSQYLGPEGKGTQSIILTTISFILIFANFVGGATLVYLTPRFKAVLLLVPSYVWTLIMSLVSYGVLRITNLVDGEFVIHICILAGINSLLSIHSNILLGKEEIDKSNFLVLFQSLLLVMSLLAFFIFTGYRTVEVYVWSLYISLGICFIISTIYLIRCVELTKMGSIADYKPVIKEMLRLGTQNQAAHITQLLSFRLSYYILEEYKGAAALGVFSNGISIAESIWLVAKSMALVQYSKVSNTQNRDESARLSIKIAAICLLMSFFLVIPLLLIPAGTYAWIFGTGFEGVKPVIWTLAPGVVVYNIAIILGHYFSGTGRYYRNTIISTAGLAVSATLYFILIPEFSFSGAGIATSVSYLFTSALFLWFFSAEYKDWHKEMIPKKRELSSMIKDISGKFRS